MKHVKRAKREKEFKKLCKSVYIIVELFNKLHKIEEKNYPKLAPGGITFDKIADDEIILNRSFRLMQFEKESLLQKLISIK